MREIVLDTETTGIDPAQGHRIIEIGALEIVNQTPTGAQLHLYINPECEVEAGALEVHGEFIKGLRLRRRNQAPNFTIIPGMRACVQPRLVIEPKLPLSLLISKYLAPAGFFLISAKFNTRCLVVERLTG